MIARTVVGVFNTYTEAESAVGELVSGGLARDHISVLATDRTRREGSAVAVTETENLSAGAGSGAAVGGAAGLMLGLAALAIPGIGPIVAAGPIAAALTGAGIGAAAGGVIGGLAKVGVPSEHGQRYESAIRSGQVLVAIQATNADTGRVESILNRHGAVDIDERPDQEHDPSRAGRSADPHNQVRDFASEGTASRPASNRPAANLATGRSNVRLYDPDQSVAPDPADSRLREVFDSEWSARYSWEDFSEAWRFGHSLAVNPRYSNAEWSDVEGDARRHWESTRPNDWDKARGIVRRAWEHVHGRA